MVHPLSARRVGHLLRTILLFSAAALLISACGDDSTEPDDDVTIVGMWNVTSFQAAGTPDPIAQGMEMTLTLTGTTTAGTWGIGVENDLIEICDEGETTCNDGGNYTATATQLTLNPGDPEGETVFTFDIDGTELTLVGTIDGIPVTIVAEAG
jgi:hypothetical protein